MAKVNHPLFSNTAGGAIGRAIIFGRSTGSQIAKRWHQPAATVSAEQAARRAAYSALAVSWEALTTPQKAEWSAVGALSGITGFNAFISAQLLQNPPPKKSTWDGGATTWDGGATTWLG